MTIAAIAEPAQFRLKGRSIDGKWPHPFGSARDIHAYRASIRYKSIAAKITIVAERRAREERRGQKIDEAIKLAELAH